MPTFRELNLPEEILDKIKERCKDISRIFDLDDDSLTGSNSHGFTWSNTIEGHDFWMEILNRNHNNQKGISEFYKLYPKPSINLISENPLTYKAKFKGKEYEITIKEVKNEN